MIVPSETLADAAADLAAGRVTSRALVENCLERIERLEPRLRAWAFLDPPRALRLAEERDAERTAGKLRGPLHGIPIGIKDIIDVAGMPTRSGSAYSDSDPRDDDAPVAARLREAGAIILGKTVTTEFACFDPPPTRNPWNLNHTPGGSSSGSAAAVATGMCLAAVGSQTGGSIIRPAAYCGVAGLKPTFGLVDLKGVTPVSPHLDHVGPIGRTTTDLAIMLAAMAADATGLATDAKPPAESGRGKPPKPLTIGVWREFFLVECDETIRAITLRAIETFSRAGAKIVELALPAGFDEVHRRHRVLMAAGAARFHRRAFAARPETFGPHLAALLTEGLATSPEVIEAALLHQARFRQSADAAAAEADVLLTPAVPAVAPATLSTTGDPRFNSPFSYAGMPAVTFPTGLSPEGMPAGVQLIAGRGRDAELLRAAQWCEEQVAFSARPSLIEGC